MARLVLALFWPNFHPNTIHSNFINSGLFCGQFGFWRYFGLIFTLILYTLIFDNSGLFCGWFGFGVILV